MLPLCDFGIHDVICVLSIYGPPHLSPRVLQKGEKDLTGQNKIISWEEMATVKYYKAQVAPHWAFQWPYQTKLCLPLGSKKINTHFQTFDACLIPWTCWLVTWINRKKKSCFPKCSRNSLTAPSDWNRAAPRQPLLGNLGSVKHSNCTGDSDLKEKNFGAETILQALHFPSRSGLEAWILLWSAHKSHRVWQKPDLLSSVVL